MSVKLNVLMMAYNNEKFIEKAIRNIRKEVEQIVVVEGAWSPDAQDKRSVDNTISILNRLREEEVIDHLIFWDQIEAQHYQHYQCDKHKSIVMNCNEHRFYHAPALKQQLLARDLGLRYLIKRYTNKESGDSFIQNLFVEDPGWLFIVDSDEIYERQSVINLKDLLAAIGEEYDFLNISGKNFYFNGTLYHDEMYRRVFKIKPRCFFSDDNSLEAFLGGANIYYYLRNFDVPAELCEFYHYGYVGEHKVRKKLEMWRKDDVEKWFGEFEGNLRGEKEYQGEGVHLFKTRNPGYSDYKLQKFDGEHPRGVDLNGK